MLTRMKFKSFTAFEDLDVTFSPGINIFIGENGTGKTHLLKTAYAACEALRPDGDFAKKINDVFYPSGKELGRLVKRSEYNTTGTVEMVRLIGENTEISVQLSFSNHTLTPDKARISGAINQWKSEPLKSVFIPVKDMLANSQGFISLYLQREVHFEEIYLDVLQKALLPSLKGPMDVRREKLLTQLQKMMNGKVIVKNEEFFLENQRGTLEFTLLAEGYRKLGLLWALIQNGTLFNGSILFWDEPEANVNPILLKNIISLLLELHRMGVQIFLATHNYMVLKEFDLQAASGDEILYQSLFRNPESAEIEISSTSEYLDISPNSIDAAFEDVAGRDIEKAMRGLGKW